MPTGKQATAPPKLYMIISETCVYVYILIYICHSRRDIWGLESGDVSPKYGRFTDTKWVILGVNDPLVMTNIASENGHLQ